MILHLSSLLAAMAVVSGLDVRSGVDCPSSQAIVGKLAPLLSGLGEAGDVAWIDMASSEANQPPALRVRLVRADANVIADRLLSIQGGCEEMADTVATVLAAWETPSTSLPAILTTTDRFHGEPAKEMDRAALWLGASGGAGLVGGIAAVGNLELVLQHAGSRLSGRAAMTGKTTRQVDLNPGYVVWRRTYGSLGLGWQARRPGPGSYWQVSADVDVLLGWVTASGRGFTPNAKTSAFDYGFGAGLRGQRTLGGWALWLEARANFWPEPERAVLTGSSTTTSLPNLDVLASLGVSFRTLR